MRDIWKRKDLAERSRLFLAASIGEISVLEACEKLGISRQRFYELEDRAVAGFLEALAPRKAGRPPKTGDPLQALRGELEALKGENKKLWLYIKVLQRLAGIEPGGKKPGRRAAERGREAHDR
jgi:hypothetical protein